MPIAGMCFFHGNDSVPTGALLCDGSAVSRTTYADLFAAIGTTWDTFDGASAPAATHFRVPKSVTTTGTKPIYPSGAGTLAGQVSGNNLSHGHPSSTSDSAGNHYHSTTYGRDCTTVGNWGSSVTAWEAGTYNTSVALESTGSHSHTTTCDNEGNASDFTPESTVGKWCIWATV